MTALTKPQSIFIVSATYIEGYKIAFEFNNGNRNTVDFEPFLSKPFQNPMTSKYKNLDLFRDFEIVAKRSISWNNREMCYPFETLYNGIF